MPVGRWKQRNSREATHLPSCAGCNWAHTALAGWPAAKAAGFFLAADKKKAGFYPRRALPPRAPLRLKNFENSDTGRAPCARPAALGSLVQRELAAVRLTEGWIRKISHQSRYLQPLRHGAKRRATSPYTGEALAAVPVMRLSSGGHNRCAPEVQHPKKRHSALTTPAAGLIITPAARAACRILSERKEIRHAPLPE